MDDRGTGEIIPSSDRLADYIRTRAGLAVGVGVAGRSFFSLSRRQTARALSDRMTYPRPICQHTTVHQNVSIRASAAVCPAHDALPKRYDQPAIRVGELGQPSRAVRTHSSADRAALRAIHVDGELKGGAHVSGLATARLLVSSRCPASASTGSHRSSMSTAAKLSISIGRAGQPGPGPRGRFAAFRPGNI